MKKLRYGMVGGGPGSFIGDAHRRAINLDGQAELVAGCFSRTPEKCRETGAQLGIAPDRCYATFDEMAKAEAGREDGIDFVTIVTPNVTPLSRPARPSWRPGSMSRATKPLCLTAEQAKELETLAEEKGLLFLGDLHLYGPCDGQAYPPLYRRGQARQDPHGHGGVSAGLARL